MGLLFLSQIIQNPENLEKLMPGIEKMAEFGAAQRRSDEQAAKRGRKKS